MINARPDGDIAPRLLSSYSVLLNCHFLHHHLQTCRCQFKSKSSPQVDELDIRLQVEVKDQNMVKHPLGIYHRISTLYADPMMNSVELCISDGKLPKDAGPCFVP